QKDAHHRTVRLVADEHLLLEGTELAPAQVAVDPARRLAHLAVGEEDRRRHQLRDLFRLGHHAAIAFGHLRRRAEIAGLFFLVPPETIGVADEATDGQVLQPARAVPRALVIGVEDVALGIEANAARRTHPARRRHKLAVP